MVTLDVLPTSEYRKVNPFSAYTGREYFQLYYEGIDATTKDNLETEFINSVHNELYYIPKNKYADIEPDTNYSVIYDVDALFVRDNFKKSVNVWLNDTITSTVIDINTTDYSDDTVTLGSECTILVEAKYLAVDNATILNITNGTSKLIIRKTNEAGIDYLVVVAKTDSEIKSDKIRLVVDRFSIFDVPYRIIRFGVTYTKGKVIVAHNDTIVELVLNNFDLNNATLTGYNIYHIVQSNVYVDKAVKAIYPTYWIDKTLTITVGTGYAETSVKGDYYYYGRPRYIVEWANTNLTFREVNGLYYTSAMLNIIDRG